MANKNFVVHNGLTVGTLTIDAATGDITTSGNLSVTGNAAINTIQNGNSNVRVAANGNVTVSAVGTANVLTITATGANIAGTANVTGNANVGNLDTATAVITTGNITTINSGLLQNGTSNVTITSSGNVSVFVAGNATARAIFTSTGANIAGTANITGDGTIGGNLTVTGNFTVNGTTTTINATTVDVTDLNITVAKGALNAAAANGAGLTVDGASTFFRYESTPNSWVIDRSVIPNANATLSLGATGSRWANIWGLASSAQYADLAERYDAGFYIEPGTVVEFGGDNEVQICGSKMSTKVAGVISTAPGYLMNDTADKGDNWVPVAFTGRVPTKVVGPVAKGDLMVSAGNGHAMSCAAPVVGSVIGKALENFDAGEGVIEVVIGRF